MAPKERRSFDAQAFLESAGLGKRVVVYARREVIFSQGDPCENILYLRRGGIQLAVLSDTGKEAIIATLGPGAFLGEGALAAHPVRLETATATMASEVLVMPKRQMIRLLRTHRTFSDRFITYMLVRKTRLEADLIDQLFNSSEKRLARTLLLLCARRGTGNEPMGQLPKISQETLAEMVGTTRSRVNFFMNKFKKLGFIEDNGGLKINPSLLTVVVHDRVVYDSSAEAASGDSAAIGFTRPAALKKSRISEKTMRGNI
jgi:CRP-like cAMP-binding protein